MSVQSARLKLKEQLVIQGLPELELGVPKNWKQTKWPGFYLDMGAERFQHDFLQATDVTSGFADVKAAFVVHQSQEIMPVPDGMPLDEYLYLLASRIHESVMIMMRNRENEDDGDRGFLAEAAIVEYDFAPDDPIAAGIVTIRISQYS